MIDAEGRIVLVNAEIERLFGYSREELLGKPMEMLVPERFRGGHSLFRSGYSRDPKARPMGAGRDLYGLRKDGSEIPVEIGLKPVATDDGFFVTASILDISARRQAEASRRALEAQLRQAQKMEAVGTLAGGVAHDFNNILAGIIGYAELIQQGVKDRQITEDLHELLAAANRGKQVVEKILAFSRRQPIERRPIALDAAVREMEPLLRATLPATITVLFNLRPDAPQVAADVTSVQQVLMNLAGNSAHAMPGGGTLEITLEPFYARDSFVRARGLREGPFAMLSVRDTGTGIPREIQDRVFEPFFTTKAPGAGTGLGLSMVHAIMQEHQGYVDLESEAGRGTEVRCLFPALEGEAAAVAADIRATTAARGKGEHVLLVEDEPSLLKMGLRRLVDLGYSAVGHASPVRALEALLDDPAKVDVLLTDYTMPQMTGLELTREARMIKPDIKVVMMTGAMDDLSEQALKDAGVALLLRKPQTLPQLAAGLRSVLDVG